VPYYYRERIKIGKEGPGIVYKLALSSIYGKLSQSIGNGIFQCWPWAGMITSGCRAQVLRLFPIFSCLSRILMIATDGLLATERIVTPTPRDTGTFECRKGNVPVPLGGWEEDAESMKRGVFLARPGIYFPMQPTQADIKKVKGRGVGTGIVLRNHELIVNTWDKGLGADKMVVTGIERFCGAKTSVHYRPSDRTFTRAIAGWEGNPPVRKSPSYGEWISRLVNMSFDPMPKRAAIVPDEVRECRKLTLRTIPREWGESVPYCRAVASYQSALLTLSQESLAAKEMQKELEDQPELEYT
jgi:hypothetical protein